MALTSLAGILIQVIVGVIVVSPILWIVGRVMVGGRKARFSDAVWIVILGIIINTFIGAYLHGVIGFIVTLIVWLALTKHFFDTGWGTAILIAIVAIIILGVVVLVLAFLGIAFLSGIGVMRGIL
ncbi:MAG: hypothetical protein ACUVTM_07215 [Candidatus Bathyarchaeia archaeon]